MSRLKTSEVTPDVIAGWKEKYDAVFEFAANDDSGFKGFFRTPTNDEVDSANSVGNKPMQSNMILAKACMLAGDDEILTVKKYFNGLCAKLATLIKRVEGEMKEL